MKVPYRRSFELAAVLVVLLVVGAPVSHYLPQEFSSNAPRMLACSHQQAPQSVYLLYDKL
jgi:hypothetical protein